MLVLQNIGVAVYWITRETESADVQIWEESNEQAGEPMEPVEEAEDDVERERR